MWCVPSKERLDKIPNLYETEGIPLKDKLIYLHFFIGGCDWYIAEYDGVDTFFGYAILNGDLTTAQWGYVRFSHLKNISFGFLEVDCEGEEFWTIRPFAEIIAARFPEIERGAHAA